jgi:hypothetical protein
MTKGITLIRLRNNAHNRSMLHRVNGIKSLHANLHLQQQQQQQTRRTSSTTAFWLRILPAMAFSPMETALIQVFQKLNVRDLAARAQVDQLMAQSVLSSVKENIILLNDEIGVAKETPTTAEVYSLVELAVKNIDIQKLVINKHTTTDSINRALTCVLVQTHRIQANNKPSSLSAHGASPPNTQSVVGQIASTNHPDDLQWPASIPEYVHIVVQPIQPCGYNLWLKYYVRIEKALLTSMALLQTCVHAATSHHHNVRESRTIRGTCCHCLSQRHGSFVAWLEVVRPEG